METRIDIHETSFDKLLKLIEENVEVVLYKEDLPVARVSPVVGTVPVASTRVPGLHAGTTWVSEDFDDPLPDEFWLGEE